MANTSSLEEAVFELHLTRGEEGVGEAEEGERHSWHMSHKNQLSIITTVAENLILS